MAKKKKARSCQMKFDVEALIVLLTPVAKQHVEDIEAGKEPQFSWDCSDMIGCTRGSHPHLESLEIRGLVLQAIALVAPNGYPNYRSLRSVLERVDGKFKIFKKSSKSKFGQISEAADKWRICCKQCLTVKHNESWKGYARLQVVCERLKLAATPPTDAVGDGGGQLDDDDDDEEDGMHEVSEDSSAEPDWVAQCRRPEAAKEVGKDEKVDKGVADTMEIETENVYLSAAGVSSKEDEDMEEGVDLVGGSCGCADCKERRMTTFDISDDDARSLSGDALEIPELLKGRQKAATIAHRPKKVTQKEKKAQAAAKALAKKKKKDKKKGTKKKNTARLVIKHRMRKKGPQPPSTALDVLSGPYRIVQRRKPTSVAARYIMHMPNNKFVVSSSQKKCARFIEVIDTTLKELTAGNIKTKKDAIAFVRNLERTM